MENLLEQFSDEWTLGAWSIGQTMKPRWTASVHGHGSCSVEWGNSAREAFDNAVADFRSKFPDEQTAKAKRLESLRKELAELESAA